MNENGNDMSPYCAAGELAGVTSLVDDFLHKHGYLSGSPCD